MKKIISVVGARPNFMKIAPIYSAFKKYDEQITHLICHTGQHYDEKMSKIFFDELKLPKPDFYLNVGSGTHAEQTGKVMIAFEKILLEHQPDLVIVVGDVNSTIACSLTAKKLQIKVAHIEAGLRSFDRTMPEEINRILTDSISDYLFVTEQSAIDNLKHEGISDDKVFFVGNVMIDSLVNNENRINSSGIIDELQLKRAEYILCTLHRPSNVDSKETLEKIIALFNKYSKSYKVIFPVHPRTKANIERFGLNAVLSDNILLTDPIGYIDFLALVKNAKLILTDSGGIQEESTYLGVPCITLRENTERPVTVSAGTNYLVGMDVGKLKAAMDKILHEKPRQASVIPFWDGKASERICKIICEKLSA